MISLSGGDCKLNLTEAGYKGSYIAKTLIQLLSGIFECRILKGVESTKNE